MEMEKITSADKKDERNEEESAELQEMGVMEAPEGMDKEEENVYSKLKDPAEDVYHLASLVKQPQKQRTNFTRFRLFRAVAAILTVICLILLVVIIALAMKLQTLSVCPDKLEEGENTDWSSVCTVDRCMATFPQGQVHATKCLKCGRGWVEFESLCFLHSRDRRTWSDSRRECQARGGDLAVLNQDRVQNFLSQASKDLYWIGLSRSHSGVWAWVDNSTLSKRNWSEQPGDADCMYLNGAEWAAAKCSAVSYYICQKKR